MLITEVKKKKKKKKLVSKKQNSNLVTNFLISQWNEVSPSLLPLHVYHQLSLFLHMLYIEISGISKQDGHH